MTNDKKQEVLVNTVLRGISQEYDENVEFNSYLDVDELIKIGSMEFEKSRALFWLDRNAYEVEKTEWENQKLLDNHNELISLVKKTSQVSQFHGLVDAVKRRRIVPFVGAGFSKPMNMPLWHDALEEIYSIRMPNLESDQFQKLVDNGDYLSAAQILADHDPTITNNYISTTYSIKDIKGPVGFLPKIASGCIVTTNFDAAIEAVFRRENKPFDGYMHGIQQNNFFSKLIKRERCLLKLHGNAEDPGSYIFTQSQYTNAYGNPFNFCNSLPKALRQIYVGNSLLFLGCSLNQDKTLELFLNVKDSGEYEIPNHYALLSEDEDAAIKQDRESKLLNLNIQPIWYPKERHELVDRILQLVVDITDGKMSIDW